MKIYYDNEIDNATVTSGQTITNYPPSNVKHSNLTRIYKGAEYSELQVDAGGGLKNISEAYTNLVQDPTDLTTSNWTLSNGATAASSSETYQGLPMTKIGSTTATADPRVSQNITVTSGVSVSYYIVLRNGNHTNDVNDRTELVNIAGTNVISALIRWVDKTVSVSAGNIKYKWVDDDTIVINAISDTTSSTTLGFRIDPIITADTSKYIYATACQLVDNTECFYPFISGSKTADTITEDFTMPDKFTFDMVVTPFFQYDTIADKSLFSWFSTTDIKTSLLYSQAVDRFEFSYDDPNFRDMETQQYDDGATYVSVNQRIRLVGSIDLTTGTNEGSRFIDIPLELGNISEDVQWSDTIDPRTTSFPTLSIGHRNNTIQANSNFEYLRIYEGLLVGTVSSSSDVDTLLEDKKVLLDVTYQNKITATDLLLANTTINDGDTILLRANDVDSFNAGTPVDEVVTWDKNIIHHKFTKASHQYWWLSVNSSNAVEIGRMFLGESYTPPGIGPTVTEVDNTADVKSLSIGGQTYGDARYNFKQFITTFPALTHDEKADIQSFFDSITNIKPFFIEFNEECSDLERYYVTLDQSDVRFTALSNPAYYTASINYLESK